MTKKKTITIIIICAAVLLIGYLAVAILAPRALLALFIKNTLTDVGEGAAQFTEYDVTADYETVTLSNGHIDIDVSADFEKYGDDFEATQVFRKGDTLYTVVFCDAEDNSEFNFINEENYESYEIGMKIGKDNIKKGFESICGCAPDTSYTTFKCIYSIDEEDYSFWDINKSCAYVIGGVCKETLARFGDVYIYESDDICGFVQLCENSEQDTHQYRATVDLYCSDDYNTRTALIINTETVEEIYAILNSARPAV